METSLCKAYSHLSVNSTEIDNSEDKQTEKVGFGAEKVLLQGGARRQDASCPQGP